MSLLAAALAVFSGQLVKGVTGFGGALVAVPALAWLYGPADAVFLAGGVDLLGSAYLISRVRRNLRWSLILLIFLPMLGGQWVGTELLAWLPEVWVRRALGTAVLVMGAEIVANPTPAGVGALTDLPARRPGVLGLGALAGAAGGVMGGLVGAPGPPIVWFMRRTFAPSFFRIQLIGVFTLGAMGLTSMCWAKGLISDGAPRLLLTLAIPVWLGAATGHALAPHLPPRTFARVVGVILCAAGVALWLR